MIRNFEELMLAARKSKGGRIAVAGAESTAVLEAVTLAKSQGIMEPILVGDRTAILKVAEKSGLDVNGIRIEEAKEDMEAAVRSVELVHRGEADGLMKGKVPTPLLLKAVLDKKYDLRTDRLLSHAAVMEIPSYPKLMIITDGGMVIAPTLEQKKSILQNAADLMVCLGVKRPKAAILAAIETVNPEMPETVHAASLVEMANRGELGDMIVEGPVAVDVALSPEAARIKGIESRIAGDVDILLVPNIATGNILAKALLYLAGAKIGGLIVGARKPIILLSRADDADTKFRSIALGTLAGL